MNARMPKPLPVALLAILSLSATLAQSVTATVPGLGLVIAGNGTKQTLKCGDAVTVNGNSNTLTLTGSCARVTVNGNRNRVTVATVGQILVDGNGNTVTWHQALKGRTPVIRSPGNGNTITRH